MVGWLGLAVGLFLGLIVSGLSFEFDFGVVAAVVVGDVSDDHGTSVGQEDAVLPVRYVTVGLGAVVVVVAGVRVFYFIGEVEGHSLLRERDETISFVTSLKLE